MATSLLTPGFWQAKFWPKGFWQDDFWQDKGVPSELFGSRVSVDIKYPSFKVSPKTLFLKTEVKSPNLKIKI